MEDSIHSYPGHLWSPQSYLSYSPLVLRFLDDFLNVSKINLAIIYLNFMAKFNEKCHNSSYTLPDVFLAEVSVTKSEQALTWSADVRLALKCFSSFIVFWFDAKHFSFSDINRLISCIKLSIQPLNSASVSACTFVCF